MSGCIVSTKTTKMPFNWCYTACECLYLVVFFYPIFYWSDLDLDPMTLLHELDVDILKMYPHAKNEVSRLRLSNVWAWAGQMHTQRDGIKHITTAAFLGGNCRSYTSYYMWDVWRLCANRYWVWTWENWVTDWKYQNSHLCQHSHPWRNVHVSAVYTKHYVILFCYTTNIIKQNKDLSLNFWKMSLKSK